MSRLAIAFCATTLLLPGVALAQSRPVIERIEPTSGPAGTQVEIIGRQIDPRSRILLGDREMAIVRRLPNRWTVRVPGGAGSGSVVIAIDGRQFRGPYFRVMEARPAPVVEGLSPAEGPPGTAVTISGQNFSPRLADNRVTLSGRPVVVRSATPTALDVIVPSAATSGAFVVQVAQAGEASSDAFTVSVGTSVAGFRPRVGPPGTEVTLTGTGFSATRGDNRVYINNLPARVSRASKTELVVTLPERAASGPLVVDVEGAGRARTSEAFRVQHPPVISGLEPTAGTAGTVVTLDGSNFGNDPRGVRVTMSGRPIVLRSVSARRLRVQIPPGATTGKIEVTINGLGPIESPQQFEVIAPPAVGGFRPGPPAGRFR